MVEENIGSFEEGPQIEEQPGREDGHHPGNRDLPFFPPSTPMGNSPAKLLIEGSLEPAKWMGNGNISDEVATAFVIEWMNREAIHDRRVDSDKIVYTVHQLGLAVDGYARAQFAEVLKSEAKSRAGRAFDRMQEALGSPPGGQNNSSGRNSMG